MKNLLNKMTMLVLTISLISCGQQDGEDSSDDPSEGGTVTGGTTGGTTLQDLLPEISFTVPSAASDESASLALTADSKNVLERWGGRIERIVDRANQQLSKIEERGLADKGAFFNKGPDGDMSGEVKASTDGDYTSSAIFCKGSEIMVHLKWNDDGTKISYTRDFGISTFGLGTDTTMKAKLIFSKETDANVVLTMDGKPWNQPSDITDGEYITSYINATIKEDGAFEISGVNDWHGEEVTEYEGEGYLLGAMSDSETGEFIGYKKADTTNCTDTFDEDAGTGFCKGRSIGSDTNFTSAEITEAYDRLSVDQSIVKKEMLATVSFDDDATCPSE